MRRRHVVSSCLWPVILMCVMMASDAVTVVSYSNVTLEEAWLAVDNDASTSWTLGDGQTTGSFTAEFDQPHTVSNTKHTQIIRAILLIL